MIIGINGRFLTRPYTGIGQYTRYLFTHYARQNPDDTLIMVVPKNVETDFPSNVKIVVTRERLVGTAGMKKTHWEQVKVPRIFKKYNVDVAHFPYPSNPWRGFEKPVAATVHDTIPWILPEYRRSFLTRLYQDRARKAVAKADRVVTVSQTSKKAIVKACGVDADNIEVIYNAPAPHFFNEHSLADRERILKKYSIRPDQPFFLYVGGFDARKNVQTVVDVYLREIAPSHAIDLVVAGDKALQNSLYASFDHAEKHRRDQSVRTKGGLRVTGFVEEADLPALYQSALAFVSLSSAEGFNLPVVEAAASRIPLIVSNIPVHHEVIGEYALYVDPHDGKGLAATMKRLLTDEDFYAGQKAKMRQYECPYSLEESARALKNLYRTLVKI